MRAASWVYWLAASVVAVVTLPLGFYVGHGMQPASAATWSDAQAVPRDKMFPGANLTWSGSGRYRVPQDAAPGIYLIAAGKGMIGCSWSRRSADNNSPRSEIQTGMLNPGTSGQVVVQPGDKMLVVSDCYWEKA